jgi:hypothetical protein
MSASMLCQLKPAQVCGSVCTWRALVPLGGTSSVVTLACNFVFAFACCFALTAIACHAGHGGNEKSSFEPTHKLHMCK